MLGLCLLLLEAACWDFGKLSITNDSLSQCYSENAENSFNPQGTCSSECINYLHFTGFFYWSPLIIAKKKHCKINLFNLIKLLNENVQATEPKTTTQGVRKQLQGGTMLCNYCCIRLRELVCTALYPVLMLKGTVICNDFNRTTSDLNWEGTWKIIWAVTCTIPGI